MQRGLKVFAAVEAMGAQDLCDASVEAFDHAVGLRRFGLGRTVIDAQALALQLALASAQRAEQFFARFVGVAKADSVRKAARELRAEEREHVALIKAWMKKVPKPASNWADDPDPPRDPD